MKKQFIRIALTAMAFGIFPTITFASTSGSTIGGRKSISVNSIITSHPFTRVADDAGTLTSYIGVWYLGQPLREAGGNYQWDPTSKTFDIIAPGVDAKTMNISGGVGTGDTTIEVNGVIVKKVHSFAAQDPAGSQSDIATFMPLFYLGEIFSKFGGSSWDGNTFDLKSFTSSTSKVAPATDVISTVASALGISTGELKNPSNKNDMTLEDFDQLYWNYIGTSSANATKAPGNGNVVAWANAVHLNDGITGNLITLDDLSTIKTNIQALMQHYLAIGNGVNQLRLSVFNMNNSYYSLMSTAQSRAAWTECYKMIDSTEVFVQDGAPVIRVPAYAMNSTWQVGIQIQSIFETNDNHFAYSTDGGNTWTDIIAYDSGQPTMGGMTSPPAFVEVKPLIQQSPDFPQPTINISIFFLPPMSETGGIQLEMFSITYSPELGFTFPDD